MGTFEQWARSLLATASTLYHERLTPPVEKSVRDLIEDCFQHLDALNVSHRFQNACLYVAEHYDHRKHSLTYLMSVATRHADHVIYKTEV